MNKFRYLNPRNLIPLGLGVAILLNPGTIGAEHRGYQITRDPSSIPPRIGRIVEPTSNGYSVIQQGENESNLYFFKLEHRNAEDSCMLGVIDGQTSYRFDDYGCDTHLDHVLMGEDGNSPNIPVKIDKEREDAYLHGLEETGVLEQNRFTPTT